jgi:gliding motility-associated lipoprotein GldH
MNKIWLWVFIFFLTSLSACEQNRLYEKYEGLASLHWKMNDTISFDVEPSLVPDANILAVKYNTKYPFRNLYLSYVLKDSLNNILKKELINMNLFESTSGKPLGQGYGSTYTQYDTLAIDENIKFSKIQFIQYMRVEKLEGIEAIGLKKIKRN